MQPTHSFPKQNIRILLLEGISETATNQLTAAGYANITHLPKALDSAQLTAALQGVHILGIRSRTRLTAEVIAQANRLMAVGCFSVGTNQVDLAAARTAGIPVFNAPFSNTRSVAELTIAEIVMLFRRILPRSNAAHTGQWDKSAAGSHEIRGKTLGIVGYGNIGTQLAVIAEALGMRVLYYDHTDKLRHGNAEPASDLEDLLARADVVTLHVPETPRTRAMMGPRQIRMMKKGSFLINNARGHIIDLDALAAALKDGHIAGAAVDVFPIEPSSNTEPFTSPLQGLENVILTPHIGGSTEEAQERIGAEVASKFIEYSDVGSTTGAVNFPQVLLPMTPTVTRFIRVQKNTPGEIQRLNEVFSARDLSIAAQHFQTDGEIGYVVLDAEGSVTAAEDVLKKIRSLDGTIRARLLHRPS
jgi:D-3-phosphoglycerate dehydrogenase / 2-oxoglutarate reductase